MLTHTIMDENMIKLSTLAIVEIEAVRHYVQNNIDDETKKRLRTSNSSNLYGVITEHYNSDYAISLIRKFTPIVYPATAVEDLKFTVKTTQNRSLFISFGKSYKDRARLFWSPLEMLLLRIEPFDINKVYTYILGDIENIWPLDIKEKISV